MGLPAYAETCPQYLFLSYDDYEREGFEGAKYVMSPPLREKWHQDVLWKGLRRNDLQVVSTDHCPFCMNEPPQKQLGADDFSKIPNGAPGHRDAADADLGGRARAPHRHPPVRRARRDEPGEDVRPVAAQGHDRGRLRRRPRGVGSRQAGDAVGQDAPHARGLQPVRGPRRDRRAGRGALARRGHRRSRRSSTAAAAAASSSSASPGRRWSDRRG